MTRARRHPARFFSLLLLTALCVLGASGQPRADVPGGTIFSFGQIGATTPVSRTLVIRNIGTDTLVISNVSAACGCTGTLMSADHVPPHDSATLSISFNPHSFVGHVEKAVTMETNDTANAWIKFHFSAEVVKTLEVDPEYLSIKTVTDSATTHTMKIRNASGHPIVFRTVATSVPWAAAKMSRESLDPGQEATLTLSLKPPQTGAVGGSIELTTDNSFVPKLSIRFFAWVKDARGAAYIPPK